MFVYWLMLVLQKGNRCSLFFLKRHLPSSSFYESRRRQPSIPTAQARLQGLQADPRRLANAHAAHKTPGKTSASTAVRRLALNGQSGIRRLSFCLRSASLHSHQNANPLLIHSSLRSIKQIAVWRLKPSFPREFRRFRDFSYGQNLCISYRNSLLQKS